MQKSNPQTTKFRIYPTHEMVEAGARAAYGTVMINEEDWPGTSGSVPADTYRDAAHNCFNAMMKVYNEQN